MSKITRWKPKQPQCTYSHLFLHEQCSYMNNVPTNSNPIKPIAQFSGYMQSSLQSFLSLKTVFVFHDRTTAVCALISVAQGTLTCRSLLQVWGMTNSKKLSISFSSAKNSLIPKWPLNLLAYSVKQSGWLAVQMF